MSNPSSTTTSNPAIPTAAQLADTRLKQWHQQGEALLTIENLRAWINAAGLVLFTPRPQIASPAPSLVESVLGTPNPNPTLEQTAEARNLLARLVAEGLAVPLNLLGPGAGTVYSAAPGDTPDFVASTAVFSYVFTLRGDKAWKQAPATSGALKVSHLGLAIHDALSQRGPLSAYDLTAEVGKEVTEAAVLRALGELWTHLRVLPLAQPDGRPTLWELASARFTKQIKAGANAGQPSALSALISLYLGQAAVASEDEIESFLSPLASRSRIRDVIHALLSARQLDTIAIEGRTMIHVAGALPAFLAPEPVVAPQPETVEVSEIAAEAATRGEGVEGEAPPSITKYVPKPRKVGTGYLAKAKSARFAGKADGAGSGPKRGFAGPKKDFKPSSGPAPDRERRPFKKPAAPSEGFDKPWAEERPRKFAPSREREGGDVRPPRKTFSKPGSFGRKREGFGGKPAFGGESRPPRREFAPRPERGERGERPARAAGSYAPRPRADRPQGDRPQRGEGFAPRKPFGSRPTGGERGGRPARAAGSYAPRPRADRPQGDRPQRGEGFAPRKPFGSRPTGAGRPAFEKDKFKGKPRADDSRGSSAESGKRVYRKFDAPREREGRPFSAERPAGLEGSGGFARKNAGSFSPRKFGKPGAAAAGKPGGGGKKPFSKAGSSKFAGKPASPFAKFAGNKKPWGNRPPGRKFKPSQGESA